MIERSVPKDHERENPEFVPCLRHEGEGCPRCDGSGLRLRRVCDECGEAAENLTPERTARSWEEAKALPRYCPKCNPRHRSTGAALASLERTGGLMAPRPAVEVHHEIPRCLLGLRDRADAHPEPLSGEDLQLWLDYECEAMRYGVDPDISRNELAALVEGSTVELPREEHRAIHAGQWAEWGRLGGTETLRRYGTAWFSLLARRRWGQIGEGVPTQVFGALARGGRS